jgi:membrane protein YqaA with SNARE-associated domain
MRKHPLILGVSILVIILAIVFRDRLAGLESLGLLGILLINFFASATIFLPAPAIATVVAGGALYPPLSVAVASSLGAAMGDVVGFLLGHASKNLFYKKHHTIFLIFRDTFHTFGGIIIFLVALIPNPFFDIVGVFAGFLHYPLMRFFIIIFVGRLIRNFLLASLGSAF